MNTRLSAKPILVFLAALLAIAGIFLIQRRHSSAASQPVIGGNNGGIAAPLTVGTTSGASPTASSASIPGPVAASELDAAKAVASAYVIAAHTLDYHTLSVNSVLVATKPFITAAYYRRLSALIEGSAGGNAAGSDLTYLTQFKASHTLVSVQVGSLSIASGDGGSSGVTGTHFPLLVFYTPYTRSDADSDGSAGVETRTTLSMLKQGGHWLVDGADGS
jgi:hypothetical protein